MSANTKNRRVKANNSRKMRGGEKCSQSSMLDYLMDGTNNTLNLANSILDPEILKIITRKLNDPAIREEIKQDVNTFINITREPAQQILAEGASIALNTAGKVAREGIQIALNTAEAVPGLGVAIGLARDLDSGFKAVNSVVQAGEQFVITSANSATNAMNKLNNFSQNTDSRINSSWGEFNNTNKVSLDQTQGQTQQQPIQSPDLEKMTPADRYQLYSPTATTASSSPQQNTDKLQKMTPDDRYQLYTQSPPKNNTARKWFQWKGKGGKRYTKRHRT